MENIPSNRHVLCIIGPSGSGKTTVAAELARRGIIRLTPTVTDRPLRSNEADSDHVFVGRDEFDRMQEEGQFLHVVTPFGLPYRYGLRPLDITSGQLPTVLIRAQYLETLRQFYPRAVCYQIEAPVEFAAEAVKRRQSELGSRLTDYEEELTLGRKISDRVFLNSGQDLETILQQIATALETDSLHTL